MIIRIKKTAKDYIERDPNHARLVTRRDFMSRGLLTGAMGIALPGALMRSAFAANCPAPVRNPGGLGQYYMDGGASSFAYLMSSAAADAAANNATVRTNYGMDATLQSIGNPANGGNLVINTKSVFGAVLLAGAPGYTAAQWLAVLNKCSAGFTYGPNNRDDGGEDDGNKMLAGLGRKSALAKGISNGNSTPITPFIGTPTSAVGSMTVANLEKIYSANPAGQTNAATMTNAANAAVGLSSVFGGLFKLADRKGGVNVVNNAACGFYGDSATVDASYGAALFDPFNAANQGALSGVAGTATGNTGLTTKELAMLGAYYASAKGNVGAVTMDVGGYDYHGTDPTNQQAQAARALVMFLAACDKAGAKGAYTMLSNGSAIGGGPTATTITPATGGQIGATTNGNTTINANQTTPQGDSGGFFNQLAMVFFDPAGSPPVTKTIGTINAGTGSVTSDPKVTSTLNMVAAAYHSAAVFLGSAAVDLGAVEAAFTKAGANWKDGHLI